MKKVGNTCFKVKTKGLVDGMKGLVDGMKGLVDGMKGLAGGMKGLARWDSTPNLYSLINSLSLASMDSAQMV